jgi:hypothetical protein
MKAESEKKWRNGLNVVFKVNEKRKEIEFVKRKKYNGFGCM